jgi:hypothetical protein
MVMNQLYSMAWHALFILVTGHPLDAHAYLRWEPDGLLRMPSIAGIPKIAGC